MKTPSQNFWIVIKFPIIFFLYAKGNTPPKIIFVKSSKVKMVFTKKKFFYHYLWPVLEKARGTGTTCRREIYRGKEFLSFTPLTIQQAFFFKKIDKILLIQLLWSYFILVLDLSYSQKSLQWEMPENKIIYLKLKENY